MQKLDGLLQEDDHAYYLVTTLAQSADRVRLATFRWEKVPFSIWWHAIMNRVSLDIRELAHSYGPIGYAGFPAGCSDDTWSPIVPPHLQRAGFTVVWTGSEMIVWGGGGATGERFNTGERYDPGTDTWTPTGLGPNVPEPRWGHTAVWTGTEMIVWGGHGSCYPYNYGGRYDPVTDSWRSISPLDSTHPGRRYNTAVWTGSDMIVWGGAASDEVDTGGIYSSTHILVRPVSLPDGVKGVFYTLQLLADGGSPPYSFSLLFGSLPTGLTLSATGVLSGVTNDVGTFNFVVGVTDGQGCTRLRGTTEFRAEAGNTPGATRGSLPGQRFSLVIRPTLASREEGHGRSIGTRSSLGE